MTSTTPVSSLQRHRLVRDERNARGLLLAPGLVVVGLVLYLPIAWMLWSSFRNPTGWTFDHYGQLVSPNNVNYLITTFRISVVVVLAAIGIGFPAALGMTEMPPRLARFCMLLVLMPFFTSVLVRTYAWLLLLQRRGLINSWLQSIGWIDDPLRLVYNELGTTVGMVHVLLPLAIMPIYGALRSIDPSLPAAAATLGASPLRVFLTVTVPLSMPGVAAGATSVFVLALGFFVTPAILGGGRVVTWAMLIETVLQYNPDWGAASALGIALLAVTLIILALVRRLKRSPV